MLNLQNLIDDAQCYETVRELRWPEGVRCAQGGSPPVTQQGRDTTQPQRQKYYCQGCGRYFDDLTGTVVAGHPQPLRTGILCRYFRGLNLSNRQIAREWGLNKDDLQRMTEQLRQGVVTQRPQPVLSDEVACDEIYGVAGHKGHPEAVKKNSARDADGGGREPGVEALWKRRSHRFGDCSSVAAQWCCGCWRTSSRRLSRP